MIAGFFIAGQEKSVGVLISAQTSPSFENQGIVASTVSSTLPTTTVCLIPLAFVNTVEYISFKGKSEGTSSPSFQVVSPALFAQKKFFPSFAQIPVSIFSLPVTSSAGIPAKNVTMYIPCISISSQFVPLSE